MHKCFFNLLWSAKLKRKLLTPYFCHNLPKSISLSLPPPSLYIPLFLFVLVYLFLYISTLLPSVFLIYYFYSALMISGDLTYSFYAIADSIILPLEVKQFIIKVVHLPWSVHYSLQILLSSSYFHKCILYTMQVDQSLIKCN